MRSMLINMEEAKLQTLVQIKAFWTGHRRLYFGFQKRSVTSLSGASSNGLATAPHGRVDKGVLLRYIERMTGLSRQQVTRLARQYRKDGKLSKQPCAPKQGFTYRCGRLCDANAIHRHLREDQRGVFAAGHPTVAGWISVCYPGAPFG